RFQPTVREPAAREPAAREPTAREPTAREPTARESNGLALSLILLVLSCHRHHQGDGFCHLPFFARLQHPVLIKL
ncbi:MAG: hypothetical protein WA984_04825, partial [Phormidesmis sp.]